jgi:hypothetical protein
VPDLVLTLRGHDLLGPHRGVERLNDVDDVHLDKVGLHRWSGFDRGYDGGGDLSDRLTRVVDEFEPSETAGDLA